MCAAGIVIYGRVDAAKTEHIAALTQALVLARAGLAEAIEASVRRGNGVSWDTLEERLRTAHDAVHAALQGSE